MNRGQEIAWAAGLFEGEGHIGRHGRSRQLRLSSTDRDVVERFQKAVNNRGTIVERRETEHKPIYRWGVSSWIHVKPILEMFLPYLGKRRNKAAKRMLAHPPRITFQINMPRCGQWMPRSATTCARPAGHRGNCLSPQAVERQNSTRGDNA